MTLFRILSVFIVLSVCVVPSPVFAADADGGSLQYAEKTVLRSILEFFYPSLRTPPPDVEKTLQAPFSNGEDAGEPLEFTPEADQLPTIYDEPHRLTGDIGRWLAVVLSETMTFDEDDYQDDLKKTSAYFDTNGRALYLKFLEENKIVRILESRKFYIRSFVQDAPLLLNEGKVGDYYRWLFEIPILVSYMDRNMDDYAKGDATTQVMTLRVQLARSPQAGEFGVVIDQWDGEGGKVKKPEK